MTSGGGYPSPSLQWLMENAGDVTNRTHTQLKQDQHTHLYSVHSKLNLSGVVNSSITFIMKNPDLEQEIRRNINLFSGKFIHSGALNTTALNTTALNTATVNTVNLKTLTLPLTLKAWVLNPTVDHRTNILNISVFLFSQKLKDLSGADRWQ